MWYAFSDPAEIIFPAINGHTTRFAKVEWRPPQTDLHYPALYAGIWEYLRRPPTLARKTDAQEYLAILLSNTVNPSHSPRAQLQRDRILWVRAWLTSLAEGGDEERNINNNFKNFNNFSSLGSQVFFLSSIRSFLLDDKYLDLPRNSRDSKDSKDSKIGRAV